MHKRGVQNQRSNSSAAVVPPLDARLLHDDRVCALEGTLHHLQHLVVSEVFLQFFALQNALVKESLFQQGNSLATTSTTATKKKASFVTHLSSLGSTTTTMTIVHGVEGTGDVLREAVLLADVVKVDVGVLHRHAATLLCVRPAAAARNNLRLGVLPAAAHQFEHAAKHRCLVHPFLVSVLLCGCCGGGRDAQVNPSSFSSLFSCEPFVKVFAFLPVSLFLCSTSTCAFIKQSSSAKGSNGNPHRLLTGCSQHPRCECASHNSS